MKKNLILLFAHFTIFTVVAQLNAQQVDVNRIQTHISYLASDKLEGRAPGTKGEKKAIHYISKEFKKIGLKPAGTNGYKQKFDYKYNTNPHDTTGKSFVAKKGSNVVGFLDNGAPYTIVIGGHFDHLGVGHHSSALDTDTGIHNGADDNASGTAGVIELANYFAGNNIKESNNFLFICFSAEEDGLVGSKHFTQIPTVNLDQINCMINMDMIGRLDPATRKLMVYGVGTSPQFAGVIDTNDRRFKFVIDSSGVGPTDHTSFYLKNIPVLSFFTGQHSDYHKASDDVEKINFNGEGSILNYIASVINQIDKKGKIAFSATRQKEQGGRTRFKVSMGIMPDYTSTEEGLRVDAVTDGKPAQIAGIKGGDIIVAMDSKSIKDVYEYMNQLGTYKAGDVAVVKVKRGSENLEFKITFR